MASLQQYESFLASVRENRKRVLVIGDAMDDVYVFGRQSRMAPEGGAPVFECEQTVTVDGGVVNVAKQLESWNVSCWKITQDGERHRKTRYIDNGKLVLVASHDEKPAPIRGLVQNVEHCLGYFKPNAIVVADYAKGAVTAEVAASIVRLAKQASIPLIVDPSPNPGVEDDIQWSGATVVKMNRSQWARRRWARTGDWLDRMRVDGLVITNGDSPPLVKLHDRYEMTTVDRPAFLPVVDTSGAGDHFSAVLTVGLVHGLLLEEAAEYAHEASRIRAAYRRPRPVLPSEVRGAWDAPLAKIALADDLDEILAGKKVVFTNGCFTAGLHAGHSSMLSFAKQQGDVLVVGVNDDESAIVCKGKLPLMPVNQRARIVAGNAAVDFVVVFGEATPVETMRSLGKIHCLVKGDEYRGDDVPGASLVDRIEFAPTVYREHTSDWFSRAREMAT